LEEAPAAEEMEAKEAVGLAEVGLVALETVEETEVEETEVEETVVVKVVEEMAELEAAAEVEEKAGLAVVASVAAGSVVAGLDTPYNHTSVVQSDTDTTRHHRFELHTPRRNWAVCSPRLFPSKRWCRLCAM
jgi:hypothetical protein